MNIGLIGTKLGMTREFISSGQSVPVTVIKIETGSYRGTDQSGRVLPIVKDFQSFSNKPGGFVTCAVSELPGYEGLDKVRINVPSLTSFQIVAEGEYIKFRDELQKGEKPAETEESDEEAIGRIEGKFNILNEMAEANELTDLDSELPKQACVPVTFVF